MDNFSPLARRFSVGLLLLLTLSNLALPSYAQETPNGPHIPTVTGAISGRVTDEAGEPLAGIVVTAEQPTFSVTAKTNSAGRYRINSLTTGLYRLRFNDANEVYAPVYYGDTQVYEFAESIAVAGSDVPDVDVTMARGAKIRGTVTFVDGLAALVPEGGISLKVEYGFYDDRAGGLEQIYTDYQYFNPSDASEGRYSYVFANLIPGRYRICTAASMSVLAGGEYYESLIHSECHDDALRFDDGASIDLEAGETADSVDITLGDSQKYATLTGRVTGVDGEPLAGVLVETQSARAVEATEPDPLFARTFVQTNEDGVYRFDTLVPDTYSLGFYDVRNIAVDGAQIRHLDEYYGNTADPEQAELIRLAEQETRTVDMQLTALGAISGRIEQSAAFDRYLSLELIEADSGEQLFVPNALRQARDGRALYYRLENVPSGRYYLRAISNVFMKYYPNLPTLENATPVAVEAGRVTSDIDFTDISKGPENGVISGRATLANGDPATNLAVGLYADLNGSGYFDIVYLGMTDGVGRYRLAAPQSGVYRVCYGVDFSPLPEYEFECYVGLNSRSDFVDEAREITVNSGETVENVDILARRQTLIRGRVQTEDGLAIEYGDILLFGRSKGSGAISWELLTTIPLDAESGTTYGLTLAPGSYRLGVEAYTVYGYQLLFYPNAPTLAEAETVEIARGEQLRDLDLILPDPADAVLSGTVTSGGEPQAGVRVELYYDYRATDSTAEPLVHVTTDADGRYEIGGLFPSFYLVRFVDPKGELTTRWYGNSPIAARAQFIDLLDGETRDDININLLPTQRSYLPIVGG